MREQLEGVFAAGVAAGECPAATDPALAAAVHGRSVRADSPGHLAPLSSPEAGAGPVGLTWFVQDAADGFQRGCHPLAPPASPLLAAKPQAQKGPP